MILYFVIYVTLGTRTLIKMTQQVKDTSFPKRAGIVAFDPLANAMI